MFVCFVLFFVFDGSKGLLAHGNRIVSALLVVVVEITLYIL